MTGEIDAVSFIKKFEAQFEEVKEGSMKLHTRFRDLEEWSSMQSLVVIASFDWEYGVSMTAEELKKAQTVEDLLNTVKRKTT